MERVIGLGGLFLKSEDPKKLIEWYQKHLGINFQGSYIDWKFQNADGTARTGSNVFSIFKKESAYFDPSDKMVMINFIVRDLFALISQLKEEGVTIVGEPMAEDYGKFGWILDPEGNKIELWEPPV